MIAVQKRISSEMPVDQLNIHIQYIYLLQAAGIKTVGDLEHWTREELAAQGIGPAGLAILQRLLNYHGYTLAELPVRVSLNPSEAEQGFSLLTMQDMND